MKEHDTSKAKALSGVFVDHHQELRFATIFSQIHQKIVRLGHGIQCARPGAGYSCLSLLPSKTTSALLSSRSLQLLLLPSPMNSFYRSHSTRWLTELHEYGDNRNTDIGQPSDACTGLIGCSSVTSENLANVACPIDHSVPPTALHSKNK